MKRKALLILLALIGLTSISGCVIHERGDWDHHWHGYDHDEHWDHHDHDWH